MLTRVRDKIKILSVYKDATQQIVDITDSPVSPPRSYRDALQPLLFG